MKILISACAADNGQSGIGHYIESIVGHLADDPSSNEHYIVYVEQRDTFLDNIEDPSVEVKKLSSFFSSVVGNILWHFLLLPVIAPWSGVSLVIFLAANRRLGVILGITTIGVVHDLSQLHIPGKYDRFRTFYVLRLLPILMRRLSRVIAVSHSTAKDIRSFVRVPESMITVIHNGADLQRFSIQAPQHKDVLSKYDITKPYIIYTARLEHPGKNHVRLIEAFCKMQNNCDVQLVLTGAQWTGSEFILRRIKDLNLGSSIVVTGFVPHEDLPALIQQASLFAFPSLYEGFGIPLLESMAAGTAVCAANVSSLPEVLGDAGLLFDPNDSQDMARVMQCLLQDSDLRNDLITKGYERSTSFTWDRTVSAMKALYQSPSPSLSSA
jgi:glycosyltransferase involved in cell wall biosynthesis